MIYEGDILRGKVMKIFSMFDGVGGFIVGLENSSKEHYILTNMSHLVRHKMPMK